MYSYAISTQDLPAVDSDALGVFIQGCGHPDSTRCRRERGARAGLPSRSHTPMRRTRLPPARRVRLADAMPHLRRSDWPCQQRD